MLTAEGCRRRRKRFLHRLGEKCPNAFDGGPLILADPIHLAYLANFHVDPFSLGGGFGGLLVLRGDGHTALIHDNRLPRSVEQGHVDERIVIPWYDAHSPGRGPRQLVLLEALKKANADLRVHDRLGNTLAIDLVTILADLRRVKEPDEIEVLRRCMKATEAGHAWARQNLLAGMTELDVYRGVNSACIAAAGHEIVVYGDFAVSPGPERRGGPPTSQELKDGDMFILDFAVVIHGYRSDFTNTLVVGGKPTAEQSRLERLCLEAMAAGEMALRADVACLDVYRAVNGVFEKAGMDEYFPHHAGHGLGLTHPEAPYIVRHANETLHSGDVITLEPGLYVPGVGGIRIEHNYLITKTGYERLSNHVISLTAKS